MTEPTIDWTVQQQASLQRSIAGGGKPGLARLEQLVGKSGGEILKGMMPLQYALSHGFCSASLLFRRREPSR